MFRPSRETPTGEDPFLLPKMMLFVAGAIFGVIGMATERDWVLGIALLCLGFGMLLRMIGRRRREDFEASIDEDKRATDSIAEDAEVEEGR